MLDKKNIYIYYLVMRPSCGGPAAAQASSSSTKRVFCLGKETGECWCL